MLTFRVGGPATPKANDTIRVYQAGTETLVTGLTDGAGDPLSNPATVVADPNGFFSLEPPSSDRVEIYWDEGSRYLTPAINLRDHDLDFTAGKIITTLLALAPRSVFMVYGDSTDGGTTPDSVTQQSIDNLLGAGVPEDNIRWLYSEVGVSNVLTMNNLVGGSYLESMSLSLTGGTFSMADLVAGSYLEPLSLAFQGSFLMDDLVGGSYLEPMTLTEQHDNIFVMTDLVGGSYLESLGLTLTGGTFSMADLVGGSYLEPMAITEQQGSEPFLFTDDFNRASLGGDYTQIGAAALSITNNTLMTAINTPGAIRYDAAPVPANQRAEIDVVTQPYIYDAVALAVRLTGNFATGTYYELVYFSEDFDEGAPLLELIRVVNGTATTLWAEYTPGLCTALSLQVVGTQITVQAKFGGAWSTRRTQSDANIASGQVGIAMPPSGTALDNLVIQEIV